MWILAFVGGGGQLAAGRRQFGVPPKTIPAKAGISLIFAAVGVMPIVFRRRRLVFAVAGLPLPHSAAQIRPLSAEIIVL